MKSSIYVLQALALMLVPNNLVNCDVGLGPHFIKIKRSGGGGGGGSKKTTTFSIYFFIKSSLL